MPKKLRTVLTVPSNPVDVMVDCGVRQPGSAVPVIQQVQSSLNHSPVPASSSTVAQQNRISSSTRSCAMARKDALPMAISSQIQGLVPAQNVSSTTKLPTRAVAALAGFRKGNATRGARRIVRSTHARVGERSLDPMRTRLLEMKVILRSLPGSMAEKTRLCSSSRQTKQKTAATTKPMTNTVTKKRMPMKSKVNFASVKQKANGQPTEQSDRKTLQADGPANELAKKSQLKENMSPCGPQLPCKQATPDHTDSRPTVTNRTSTENSKASGIIVAIKDKDDSSQNCLRCKTLGCHKMIEYEKQRLAQMKRQRLAKATAAGGKRRYQQRKGK